MASPPNESRTLSSYLDFDEDVNCGSDTSVPGDDGISSHSAVSEAQPITVPNSFVERGKTTAPGAQHHTTYADENIITNPLDEQKELRFQREEKARRRAHTQAVIQNRSGYVFSTPDAMQRLLQTEAH